MMTTLRLLLIILLFLTVKLYSQEISDIDKEAITKILYQHVSDDTPGMVVGIVKDGEVVYEHYLGYSNLDYAIKLDKNTRFNIASNAKQYTALCILKLVEEGKINLEDDFRKYLPDLYKNIEDKITISNLLTHTSGIRDYCDLIALQGKTWWKQFIDNGDAVELLQRQKDLNFKPGTAFTYSNSNYILLSEIVKEVTNQAFSEYAKAMFEELDMPNTNFLTNYMAVIPNKANPYGYWNSWSEVPIITEVHGDGALFTTLQDQLKWEQIIQVNNGQYLSQNLINESQAPLESSIENNYGYGLEFDSYWGLKRTFHNGATGGYRATFMRFPKEKLSLVIMTNNRTVPIDYLARQIVDELVGLETSNSEYKANPDKIEKLKNIEDVLGIYKGEGDGGTVIKITEKDGSLYREIYQRDPVKLVNEKEGLFEYETIQGLKMNFTDIGKPEQKFTLYKSTQEPSTFHKVSDLNMDNFDKEELNGCFYNDETDTEIVLKFEEDKTYTLTKNGRERNAELLFKDELRMMGSYTIRVIRDDTNKVTGLNLNYERLKNVIFDKKSIDQ